eukprot:scaffold279435_cov33-Tisochrysis_lutea.AAC.4
MADRRRGGNWRRRRGGGPRPRATRIRASATCGGLARDATAAAACRDAYTRRSARWRARRAGCLAYSRARWLCPCSCARLVAVALHLAGAPASAGRAERKALFP